MLKSGLTGDTVIGGNRGATQQYREGNQLAVYRERLEEWAMHR